MAKEIQNKQGQVAFHIKHRAAVSAVTTSEEPARTSQRHIARPTPVRGAEISSKKMTHGSIQGEENDEAITTDCSTVPYKGAISKAQVWVGKRTHGSDNQSLRAYNETKY